MEINRWQGNSGRVVRYDDSGSPAGSAPAPPKAPPRSKKTAHDDTDTALLSELSKLTRLLPDRLAEMDTEDVILLLILYLMYRESGDSDLLVIMGGLFLL